MYILCLQHENMLLKLTRLNCIQLQIFYCRGFQELLCFVEMRGRQVEGM